MECTRRWTVPKEKEYREANEDYFKLHEGGLRFALADGATESFDSKNWARFLCEAFARGQEGGTQWLGEALEEYGRLYRFSDLSWSKQMAYERGSFSTFVGGSISEDKKHLTVIGTGDTVVFVVDGEELMASWPYDNASQFAQRPLLLSTRPELNSPIIAADSDSLPKWDFDLTPLKNPVIVCATDALACWILAHDGGISRLFLLDSEEKFVDLVIAERSAGRMRRDDTTMLVFRGPDGQEAACHTQPSSNTRQTCKTPAMPLQTLNSRLGALSVAVLGPLLPGAADSLSRMPSLPQDPGSLPSGASRGSLGT